MMSEEHNTCYTCMFYDPKHDWCDKKNEGTYDKYECNYWKEKVKHE